MRPSDASLIERLEGALREDFVGFQELVVRDRAPSTTGALIPPDALRRARRPVYREALSLAELAPGAMRAVEVEGHPVLFANVGGEVLRGRESVRREPAAPRVRDAFGRGAPLLLARVPLRRRAPASAPIATGTACACSRWRSRTAQIRIAVDTVSAAPLPLRVSGNSAMTRTLIAGFGNVLRKDDGFGVEVIRRLEEEGVGQATSRCSRSAPAASASPRSSSRRTTASSSWTR